MSHWFQYKLFFLFYERSEKYFWKKRCNCWWIALSDTYTVSVSVFPLSSGDLWALPVGIITFQKTRYGRLREHGLWTQMKFQCCQMNIAECLCNSAPYLHLLQFFFFSAWVRMIMSCWELDIPLVLPPRQSLVVTGTRKLPLPAGSWLIGQSRRGKCPSQWAVKDGGPGILSF